MDLITRGDVDGYFARLSLSVLSAEAPAEAFETCRAEAAETIRQNGIGKSFALDRLQQIAEAAGLASEPGTDWIQERLARVFSPPVQNNGHTIQRAREDSPPPASPEDYGTTSAAEPEPALGPRFTPVAIDDVVVPAGPACLIDGILHIR